MTAKRPSLLDDDLSYVEDDGSTESEGDICARCSLSRARHSEEGECPDRRGDFKEGA